MTNKLLEKLNAHRPNAQYIRKQSGLPYLELHIDVPTEQIMREWRDVSSRAVMHRDTDAVLNYENQGWRSLTLYGVKSGITTSTDGPHHWTDIAEKCPETCTFFEKTFGSHNFKGRIRFMLLEPGGHILPHQDRTGNGLWETNIAINNPQGCKFYFENKGIVPFTQGSAYMLDLSNRHWVVNDSDTPRLHMIYHGEVPDKIVEDSYEKMYYRD